MENNEETESSGPYQADLFGNQLDSQEFFGNDSGKADGGETALEGQEDGAFSNDALVEAVLFLEAEPVDEKQIARITSLSENDVEAALETLKERYSHAESGVELVRIGGGITIAPKKQYWEALKERYGRKNAAKLSRAAMETLAIIAYSQPITRAEIEAIRGVQADNMIRLLTERGLIRETGKKDIAGHPTQFGTTKEFLTLFRLESIADLPKLDETEVDRFEL
ncbi:MAG: SMC-Scp complex subunit ScpB [Spirochaetaceae bacterium]|jgi:segregation and condensation protein B|nr:SMC-Scp complex subunit ScpB [Spirochaetaceae bacterium]